MSGWRWVDRGALLLLHDESVAEHGGAAGIRDETLLDSALARPLNLVSDGEPDCMAARTLRSALTSAWDRPGRGLADEDE